jgi:hypothetical protein
MPCSKSSRGPASAEEDEEEEEDEEQEEQEEEQQEEQEEEEEEEEEEEPGEEAPGDKEAPSAAPGVGRGSKSWRAVKCTSCAVSWTGMPTCTLDHWSSAVELASANAVWSGRPWNRSASASVATADMRSREAGWTDGTKL